MLACAGCLHFASFFPLYVYKYTQDLWSIFGGIVQKLELDGNLYRSRRCSCFKGEVSSTERSVVKYKAGKRPAYSGVERRWKSNDCCCYESNSHMLFDRCDLCGNGVRRLTSGQCDIWISLVLEDTTSIRKCNIVVSSYVAWALEYVIFCSGQSRTVYMYTNGIIASLTGNVNAEKN